MLLRKGVVPYEYMDSWERFVEKLLPKKENFYSSLNIVDITDVDYSHVKRVFKIFNNKNIVEYHNLWLLLSDVLKHFMDKCIEIYDFDPAYF